jgi:hypothetical protein
LVFALVAWHSADVTLARTQHDVDGAVVAAGADGWGDRRLPGTGAAAFITAAPVRELGHNGLTRQNASV